MTVELLRSKEAPTAEVNEESTVDTLVYIDQKDVTDGNIRAEYISRIHRAMEDGIREGIPTGYFDRYFKPFVPS